MTSTTNTSLQHDGRGIEPRPSFWRKVAEGIAARLKRMRWTRLGHLPFRRLTPISRDWGSERGEPVDRYYIERFLERNRQFIRGNCLEVFDSAYARRFGTTTRIDVLDIDRNNPRATVFGDLQRLDAIADETYDCFIMTQTLQYIPDLHAAVAETFRILKPGGTLLMTVPFLIRLDDNKTANDFWRFTPNSVRMLLGKHVADGDLEITSPGNVLTGQAFWIGLAQEDLRARHLAHEDSQYPIIVTARATKPARGRQDGRAPERPTPAAP